MNEKNYYNKIHKRPEILRLSRLIDSVKSIENSTEMIKNKRETAKNLWCLRNNSPLMTGGIERTTPLLS